MDELIITPPYRLEDCKTPQSQGAGKNRLERVRKVLEGERARLLRLYPHLEEQATTVISNDEAKKDNDDNTATANDEKASATKADTENGG